MAARKDSELGEFFGHKSSVESISIAITEDKVCLLFNFYFQFKIFILNNIIFIFNIH